MTNYEPRQTEAGSLSTSVLPHLSKWTLDISFFDKNAVATNLKKGLGYLDRKNIYSSAGIGSALTIFMPISKSNPIWLCECQKGFLQYPSYMGDLIETADVYLYLNYDKRMINDRALADQIQQSNGNFSEILKLPEEKRKNLQKQDLELLSDQCYRTKNDAPTGSHLLVLVQKGNLLANLAYVVSWNG
jgi:hypothetical protein